VTRAFAIYNVRSHDCFVERLYRHKRKRLQYTRHRDVTVAFITGILSMTAASRFIGISGHPIEILGKQDSE
jgi:hypothetical protein